jgi:hypothetical protein
VSALFEIGPADVAVTSDDWYTPRWIFDAAGLMFDVDVAAPVVPEYRTCPARRYLTPVEDGLSQLWDGLVWMNPPYSGPAAWVRRWALHRDGLALVPAAKAAWLGELLRAADTIALIAVRFNRAGLRDTGFPYVMVLAGRGECASAVARVAAVDKHLRGAYHVRPAG